VQATHTLFEKSGICADDKNRIMHIVNILAFVLKPKYLLVLRLYIEDDYLSAKRLILHMSCSNGNCLCLWNSVELSSRCHPDPWGFTIPQYSECKH